MVKAKAVTCYLLSSGQLPLYRHAQGGSNLDVAFGRVNAADCFDHANGRRAEAIAAWTFRKGTAGHVSRDIEHRTLDLRTAFAFVFNGTRRIVLAKSLSIWKTSPSWCDKDRAAGRG